MNRYSFRPLVLAAAINVIAALAVFVLGMIGEAHPWPGNAPALAWVTWALLAYIYVIDEDDR